MPRLSDFYGISVFMYWGDHPPPHAHVRYGEFEAAVDIESLELIRGRLPRRARVLLLEWAMVHRDELRIAWHRVVQMEHPPRIEPLD